MQKLGAANREIRGWFRKSCLGKTGFRCEHLLPIKVSDSSRSRDTNWRLFHWLLNRQILLYYAIYRWIWMGKSVVLTSFNNHFGVTPSTVSVYNKLALGWRTPSTIITSDSMAFHLATLLQCFLLSYPLKNVAFSEQIKRSYGNILISCDQQAPVCTLMHLPGTLTVQAVAVCSFPAFYFLQGLPMHPLERMQSTGQLGSAKANQRCKLAQWGGDHFPCHFFPSMVFNYLPCSFYGCQ